MFQNSGYTHGYLYSNHAMIVSSLLSFSSLIVHFFCMQWFTLVIIPSLSSLTMVVSLPIIDRKQIREYSNEGRSCEALEISYEDILIRAYSEALSNYIRVS